MWKLLSHRSEKLCKRNGIRIKSRKEIAGVIAGLYDYFELYENYGWKLENVRLVVVILAIVTNLPFLTAYIILAILLPDKSELN
ncbi:PspC domain-containing protein [Streptococcus ruminantium]|uniref:PspC domain-containing protein n=1 Tax=Streptococcus ruminantium TaxID=1917441 RepID=UPI001D153617|nr:PspC domain-containing protein [Streptococcus ruminantium]